MTSYPAPPNECVQCGGPIRETDPTDAATRPASPAAELAKSFDHAYVELCPDGPNGWDSRDPDCPACRHIDRLHDLLGSVTDFLNYQDDHKHNETIHNDSYGREGYICDACDEWWPCSTEKLRRAFVQYQRRE